MTFEYFIDLSSVNTFGTKKYDRQLFNYITSYKKNEKFLILCSKHSSFYNFKNKNIKVINNPFNNAYLRYLYGCIRLLKYYFSDVIKYYYFPFDVSFFYIKKKVVALRNPSPFIKKSRSYFSRYLLFFIIKSSITDKTIFLAPSNFAIRLFSFNYKIIRSKFNLIYHSYERDVDLKKTKDENLIIFISNFYPQKNLDLTIKAFNLLTSENKYRNLKLEIFGSIINNKYYEFLKEISISNKKINFNLNCKNDFLKKSISQANVMVLPTEGETFCHPFVEAMFNGVKTVCLDNAISREICVYNTFFAKKNINSIKDSIVLALNQKTDLNLKLLQRYDFAHEFKKTFDLIKVHT